jgi:hypothetical protein
MTSGITPDRMDLPFVSPGSFAHQPARRDWDMLGVAALGVPMDTASTYRSIGRTRRAGGDPRRLAP